jgi:hypothetical protein
MYHPRPLSKMGGLHGKEEIKTLKTDYKDEKL